MSTVRKLDSITDQFPSHADQIREVYQLILDAGELTEGRVLNELHNFYAELGIDDYYFHTTSPDLIAKHIQALYAAQVLARTSDQNLHLESETETGAVYACISRHAEAVQVERRIMEKYPTFRLQSYRTNLTHKGTKIRLYFLQPANFAQNEVEPGETSLEKVGPKEFLATAPETTKKRYEELLKKATKRLGPVIETSDKPETKEKRLMLAYHRGSTHNYFPAISDVLRFYGLHSNRKYIEQFSNGLVVYSIYVHSDFDTERFENLLNSLPTLGTSGLRQMVVDMTLNNIIEETRMLYVLPRTALTFLFQEEKLSAQEVTYAYAVWKFAHHFMQQTTEEHAILAKVLANNPSHMGLLGKLRKNLRKATFTEDRIFDTIAAYPNMIKELYSDFTNYHFKDPSKKTRPVYDNRHNDELATMIKKRVSSEIDQQIMLTFLQFNRHVLKTNFYKDGKVALGFRLDPSFLTGGDYPEVPFAIFYIIGSEFRGFHIRFRDIARGGIRLIRSSSQQVYSHNANTLFDENYNLAHTQQRKNKDIPEGGSKGTILLSLPFQDRAEVAFKKYVDTLLDLIMPSDEMIDYYEKEELLFLGPDEGTADLMDWASAHARERGYHFWKAFTTGKSVTLGGIPHDLYGMTTHSVHQYALGILEKEGLDEREVTKVQTGGPDGDLGSNEILVSHDITTTVIDGSGVLYDPEGINRAELTRLAKNRQMVEHFNKAKLSQTGFLVNVKDKDLRLPDGTHVESGLRLRNEFHLTPYAKCVLFVPCGGRPESINSSNMHRVFDEAGRPHFKYVVEGANLFLTQEARFKLEEAGTIIYKDASANKGGVTSSSLEVFASLVLDDDEFSEHFQVKDGVIPSFYEAYVEQVLDKVGENARMEFECIWNEHQRTGRHYSILSDEVSAKINEINDTLQTSEFLWHNESFLRYVVDEYTPPVLLQMVGLERIIERVPNAYLRAIFGAHLASRYVYRFGLEISEVAFFEFILGYMNPARAKYTQALESAPSESPNEGNSTQPTADA